ncbi:MAG: hypothetical protein COX77_01460 [Candidatus Komeilibacteria bacterium CG_4_10_14_0_2_um_filter_37_10]|uniref:STAS domain-containing protein n=1 Tax=Candidatus Komeilibacteria bacterium CG_4_10_14_0_2_um_filter_37_10 TaxID=1974470 RepID=A0A2M7VFM9_9BACT|nr:MAG: hypothetical protein COX77_01460 [Candidatus Komeilibacteria bacterium CG_4_10_14_0_2_um_filter_37_10]PJA92648.1 MAG: hypothetical protein CO133_02045 [Candidatus Komeilibacteria bacterium CG_4_9_14_3_um_filter_37_5]
MSKIIIRKKENILYCQIIGRFTSDNGDGHTILDKFSTAISGYFDQCRKDKIYPKVIVDLKKTDFVGATGLAVLISCYRLIESDNGLMVLVNITSSVRSMFELTKTYRLFSIVDSSQQALDLVNH